MKTIDVNMIGLKVYIESVFWDDDDILIYFDKEAGVKTTTDASVSVYKKIANQYYDAEKVGVEIDGYKVGYFVYMDELLVSFGVNKKYRNTEILSELWEEIKSRIGDTFQCVLYSYNTRAIGYLKKCGMKILFDNVTILSKN